MSGWGLEHCTLCRSRLLGSSRQASLPAPSRGLLAEVTPKINRAEGFDVTAPVCVCSTQQAGMHEYWLALSVAADRKAALPSTDASCET